MGEKTRKLLPHSSNRSPGVPVVTRRKLASRRSAVSERAGKRIQRRPGRRLSRERIRFAIISAFALAFVTLLVGATWGGVFSSAPQPPSKLVSTTLSPTSVKLSWKGHADIDKYVVRIGADRSLTTHTETVTSTTTTTTLKDLAASSPGIDHYFRVDAYRGKEIASSRTSMFNLEPTPIGKLKVNKVSTTGAKVTWPKVANVRQYDVEVARDKNFTDGVTAVRTVTADRSFVTDRLAPGKKYFLKIRPVNGTALGVFTAPIAVTTRSPATKFNIGTWNVCSEKCSGYAGRARIGAAFFNDNDIDIFGLQESGGQRVGRTTNAIWSGGKQGFVRASGGAEARYIFYRPALFTQVSGGFFPVGDGRHATWAHMRTKDTKRDFFYVDVHLENGHGNNAKRAREMGVLLAQMARLNSDGLPMIYAGDFNSGKHRSADSPGVSMRAAGMVDSIDVSKSDPVNARINSGHTFATSVLASGAYVDHIFVSKDFDVLAWKQLVRISNGRYIKPIVSDHNALMASVSLDAPGSGGVGEPTLTTEVPGVSLTLR